MNEGMVKEADECYEVQRKINELDNALKYAMEMQSGLAIRLAPVLIPVLKKCDNESEDPIEEEQLCPLANELTEKINKLNVITKEYGCLLRQLAV